MLLFVVSTLSGSEATIVVAYVFRVPEMSVQDTYDKSLSRYDDNVIQVQAVV